MYSDLLSPLPVRPRSHLSYELPRLPPSVRDITEPPLPPAALMHFFSPNKTSTAQAILKYDEDGGEAGEEGSGDHLNAGDDDRDPLDDDLVRLRKKIRSHVRQPFCVRRGALSRIHLLDDAFRFTP